MRAKNILFAIFDLNDTNYMKMPWALFVRTLPIIAEKIPDAKIYVLTDTKNCSTVRRLIEKDNLKLISSSRPILRYPYKGLSATLEVLCKRLDIDTLVVLSGWSIHVWNRIAGKLKINNLILIVLTPVYKTNDLLTMSLDYFTSSLNYGRPEDLIYLTKLIFENLIIRLLLKIVKFSNKPTIIVASEDSKELFQNHGFVTYKINFKLKYNITGDRIFQSKSNPSIAYFGVPLIARGYDIVIELAKPIPDIDFVLYLRERLTAIARKKMHKGLRNLRTVFKFFHSMEDLIAEARRHNLLLLPFRFVISDFPLIVVEVLCSGRLVVTTKYSHVDLIKMPNLVTLDLVQVKNPSIIRRLAEREFRIPISSCYIDWEFVADELSRFLGLHK
jgi:hypothetical protein